ncbi:PilN domain-containing protein [Nitrincola alkalilacustris]|uniref:PilN domain-containing protein n=1 Tax=Nitrincola alkalilacustris TaxID=1571224 RepID=UPI00124D41E1|nr:PilN domain-containing protein [Nitrincola alkalilacustris]
MASTDNQWRLFGIDLRGLANIWRAGWRDIAWSQDSVLRRWLDEAVRVREPGAETSRIYQAGRVTRQQAVSCDAIVLPAELLLVKQLSLPESVEADIDSALGFEIRANSPFPPDDTCTGWTITSRKAGHIKVSLVIVSRSTVNNYLRQTVMPTDESYEVWALAEDQPVVISGFGEAARYRRYERKLKRLLLGVAYSVVMLALIPAVPVLAKHQELQKLERLHHRVQEGARESVQLRARLAASNEQASMINHMLSTGFDPYRQLQTLTVLLGDDVWLASLELRKDRLRIDGRAENAASLMQALSQRPEFVEVRSPSAIRRERSGEERFVLDIMLSAEEAL